MHGDHHAVVMPGGNLIYTANDGGVAASKDGGKTWEPRNRGLVTTMFYAVDVAPTNSAIFGGGCQDNGTLVTGIGQPTGDFRRVLTGDGGWMVFDSTDETHVFGSSQNLKISRHLPGSRWDVEWKPAPLPATEVTPGEQAQTATAVMVMDPRTSPGAKTVWLGSSRLWKTTNSGGTWHPVSPFFDGSAITAIDVAPANPEQILVGTTNGRIFRSRDRGATWSANLAGPEIPMRMISCISRS